MIIVFLFSIVANLESQNCLNFKEGPYSAWGYVKKTSLCILMLQYYSEKSRKKSGIEPVGRANLTNELGLEE